MKLILVDDQIVVPAVGWDGEVLEMRNVYFSKRYHHPEWAVASLLSLHASGDGGFNEL